MSKLKQLILKTNLFKTKSYSCVKCEAQSFFATKEVCIFDPNVET